MLISQQNFVRFQDIFYRKVVQSPYFITLSFYKVITAPGSFEEFVGDSFREPKDYIFPCLYEKTEDPWQREKYGLADTVSGVVFLSPVQLTDTLGTFVIDKTKTKVFFEFRSHVIDNVTYMESMYDSCVSVQLDLKDDIKGG